LQGEKKDDAEAKDCKDKAPDPVKVEGAEVVAEKPDGEVEKTEVVETKDCKDKAPDPVKVEGAEAVAVLPDGEVKKEEVVEAKDCKDSAEKRIEADVKADHGNLPPGKAKVAQDEYAAFIAEYSEAQTLANKLRPYIKETFDSAPMRVIDVARFAAKHISTLAFVMDEADDEKVLTAVRGYAAAVAMDQAPKKPEVLEDAIPNADVIVQDAAPETPAPVANSKDLLAFLSE
jgi:hypothetical protein